MTRTIIAAAVLLASCASSQQGGAPTAGGGAGGMSKDEARRVVAAFQSGQQGEEIAGNLRNPASMEDVLAILRTDQINLFPGGVTFAQTQSGFEAKAMHAQIELAWAEANVVLADILWEDAARLRPLTRSLEVKKASGAISGDEEKTLADYQRTIQEQSRTAEALVLIASEHAARGATIAREVVEQNPDNYLGYRVAADYYRMRQDWENFQKMMDQIEATNPDSNGLVFLRGVAAAELDDDLPTAIEHFRRALEKDPEFTRAQAHLVLNQESVRDQYDEYQVLKKMNPHHQIVIWAGEAIERAFTRWEARRKKRAALKAAEPEPAPEPAPEAEENADAAQAADPGAAETGAAGETDGSQTAAP